VVCIRAAHGECPRGSHNTHKNGFVRTMSVAPGAPFGWRLDGLFMPARRQQRPAHTRAWQGKSLIRPPFKALLPRSVTGYPVVKGHHVLSAYRPALVIRIHRTCVTWPSTHTVSIVAAASPVLTRLASISVENPRSISTASAQPLCPASASISRARRHSGLSGILPGGLGSITIVSIGGRPRARCVCSDWRFSNSKVFPPNQPADALVLILQVRRLSSGVAVKVGSQLRPACRP